MLNRPMCVGLGLAVLTATAADARAAVDCDGELIDCSSPDVVCIAADVNALYDAVNDPTYDPDHPRVVVVPPGTYTLTSIDPRTGLLRPAQGKIELPRGMSLVGSNEYLRLDGFNREVLPGTESRIDVTSTAYNPPTNAGPAFADCHGDTNEATATLVIRNGAGDVGGSIAGELVTVTWAVSDAATALALASAINQDPRVSTIVFASANGGTVTLAGLPPFRPDSFTVTVAPYGTGVTAPLEVLGFGKATSQPAITLGVDTCVARLTVHSNGLGRLLIAKPGEAFRAKISASVIQGGVIAASFGNLGCAAVGARSSLVFEDNIVQSNTIGLFAFNSLGDNDAKLGSTMRLTMRGNWFRANVTAAQLSGGQAGFDNGLTSAISMQNLFEGGTRGVSLTGGVPQFLQNTTDGNELRWFSTGDTFTGVPTELVIQGASNVPINTAIPGKPPAIVAGMGNHNHVSATFVGTTVTGGLPFDVGAVAGWGTGRDGGGAAIGPGEGNTVELALHGSSATPRIAPIPAAWSPTATYAKDAVVSYPPMSPGADAVQTVYISLVAGNTNRQPDGAMDAWMVAYEVIGGVTVRAR